jgi:hypothetical protein
MTEHARIHCVALGCRRTRKPWGDGRETRWVCGTHWRLVSKVKKRRMSKALRKWNKITCHGAGGTETRLARRWCRIWWMTFEAACKEAIEASVGIA